MLVSKHQLTEFRSEPTPRAAPVVVLGGGFAGTVTALKLLDAARGPIRITIVEPRAELGGGLAYSTRESAHLMNGPAKLFSLHPERPEHFVQYLARFASDWSWNDPLSSSIANSLRPARSTAITSAAS